MTQRAALLFGLDAALPHDPGIALDVLGNDAIEHIGRPPMIRSDCASIRSRTLSFLLLGLEVAVSDR